MKEPVRTPLLIRYAAPALLVVVALIEITVAHTTELTPWKGGGFGMFSTVDDPDARWVRCFVVANGHAVPVSIPSDVERDVQVLQAMPSHPRLMRLAFHIARARWVTEAFDRDPKEPPNPCAAAKLPPSIRAWEPDERAPKANELAPVRAVRLEVWRLRFDLPTRRLVAWRADTVLQEVRP